MYQQTRPAQFVCNTLAFNNPSNRLSNDTGREDITLTDDNVGCWIVNTADSAHDDNPTK